MAIEVFSPFLVHPDRPADRHRRYAHHLGNFPKAPTFDPEPDNFLLVYLAAGPTQRLALPAGVGQTGERSFFGQIFLELADAGQNPDQEPACE